MSEPGTPKYSLETKGSLQERRHLREDIIPIRLQIVDSDVGDEELDSIYEKLEEDEGKGVVNSVDLDGGDLGVLENNGFKHSGPDSYLISPISERDWTSDHYFNCTGVVAIGRDKDTGREVSFLTHQDPKYFVDGNNEEKEKFSRELVASLKELESLSEVGTVEILLLGGNFGTGNIPNRDLQQRQYKQSIKRLREIIFESLGFDPKVITGPNNIIGSETVVVVETQKRNVWIERDKQLPEFDQSYQASLLDEAEKRWFKKEEEGK